MLKQTSTISKEQREQTDKQTNYTTDFLKRGGMETFADSMLRICPVLQLPKKQQQQQQKQSSVTENQLTSILSLLQGKANSLASREERFASMTHLHSIAASRDGKLFGWPRRKVCIDERASSAVPAHHPKRKKTQKLSESGLLGALALADTDTIKRRH